MSRNMQWQLFNELKDAIAEVLDEFLIHHFNLAYTWRITRR